MSTPAKRHPPRQSALQGRHPAVPAAAPPPTPAPAPAPAPAPTTVPSERHDVTTTAELRKFTAQLEEADDARFEDVTRAVGKRTGRVAGRRQDARGGRYPSRADVLRALLVLAEQDADLLGRVAGQVTLAATARRTGSTT